MRLLLPFLAALALFAPQQPPDTLYDEARVPAFVLPDPLVMTSGERVRDAKTWTDRRRPEILEMYRAEVFGRVPAGAPKPTFRVDSTDRQALNGRAIRKLVTITFGKDPDDANGADAGVPAGWREEARAGVPEPVVHAGPYGLCRSRRSAGRLVGADSQHEGDRQDSQPRKPRAAPRPAGGSSTRFSGTATAWPPSTTATSSPTSRTA